MTGAMILGQDNADRHETADYAANCILRLQPELQNAIYEHVIIQSAPIHLSVLSATGPSVERLVQAMEPALLWSCPSIRSQYMALYYGGNVFQTVNIEILVKWLQWIGPHKRRLLRQVRGCRPHVPWQDVPRAMLRARTVEERLEVAGCSVPQGVFRTPTKNGEGDLLWVNSRGEELIGGSHE